MRRVVQILLGAAILVSSCIRPSIGAAQEDPAERAARQAAIREGSSNNLKLIMLAMHNHHDKEKSFPAAYNSGGGRALLSWRVALLPYMENQTARDLYREFRTNEPWDSDHNRALIAKIPSVYQSPASKLKDGRTVYLTPRGATTAFPGQQAISARNITDGLSNTIGIVEVDDKQAVPWTQPEDWKFDPNQPKVGLGGQHDGGFLVALCDGSVRYVSNDVDSGLLTAFLTMAGGEVVTLPK
jgi:hypothetical protein